MTKKVEILAQKTVFEKKFFAIEETRLRHETPSGELSSEMERLTLHRGHGVAAVVYDPKQKRLLLVKQFRYPAYSQDERDAWLIELPAGMMEPDEAPDVTMRREIEEETGFSPTRLEAISVFYLTPGGSSEQMHLYYAEVNLRKPIGNGGGLAAEQEHLELLTLSRTKAAELLREGKIRDAKTIIGLQWLLQREGFHRR